MWNLEIIRIIFIFLFCGRCIFSQDISSDAQEYLNAHNLIRTQRGLPPLAWDPKLASFAQYWASQRANDCNPFCHSTANYGENIMWELYDEDSPTKITQGWADEEKNFDRQWHKCRCQPETATCKCGHYTQLVWRTTTRIGCGNYTCNSQKGFIVVCEYDPPGNYVGEDPFYPSDYYGPVPNSPPSSTTTTTTPLPPPPAPILPPPPPTPTMTTLTTTPAPTMTTLTTTTTTTTLPGSTTGQMLISTTQSAPMLAKGMTVHQPQGASVKGKQFHQAIVARRKGRHAARMQRRKYYKKRPGWGKSG